MGYEYITFIDSHRLRAPLPRTYVRYFCEGDELNWIEIEFLEKRRLYYAQCKILDLRMVGGPWSCVNNNNNNTDVCKET